SPARTRSTSSVSSSSTTGAARPSSLATDSTAGPRPTSVASALTPPSFFGVVAIASVPRHHVADLLLLRVGEHIANLSHGGVIDRAHLIQEAFDLLTAAPEESLLLRLRHVGLGPATLLQLAPDGRDLLPERLLARIRGVFDLLYPGELRVGHSELLTVLDELLDRSVQPPVWLAVAPLCLRLYGKHHEQR